MSTVVEDKYKRWTTKCKGAWVTETIQGKASVAEASQTYGVPPGLLPVSKTPR